MRKLLLVALFAFAGTALFAQNLDDINEKLKKGKPDEAREKIDKVLADPKHQKNANAWYYKGRVYSELAKDTNRRDLDYKMEAFNAYKKYQELDPKNLMLVIEQNGPLFTIYEAYYNQGVREFNNKNYVKAFDDFRKALAVKDYIYGKKFEINGFSFPAVDTQLLNLTGSAGMLAKQEDAAIPYFTTLADARIKNNDYKDIYPIIVDYYSRKNDTANKSKYLNIGSTLFPDNPYWLQTQLEEAGDSKTSKLAKYEQLMNANPTNFELATDYAVELFNYTYGQDKPSDYTKRQEDLTNALKKALAINPSNAYANFVMSQHLSNQVYDMQQNFSAIRGTKPEDIKKKQDINKQIDAKYEELYQYAFMAYTEYGKQETLKAVEKANYRMMINQLIDYHRNKKQTDKAKEYEEKLKTLK